MMTTKTLSAAYCSGCSENLLHATAANIEYLLHLIIASVDDHTEFWQNRKIFVNLNDILIHHKIKMSEGNCKAVAFIHLISL
jgi:Ni,Fe-hydrogenase I small subunit